PTINITANQFALVGNPFASRIDFKNIKANSGTANIDDVYYVWDPSIANVSYGLGGYNTIYKDVDGDFKNLVSSTLYGPFNTVHNDIESGLAFFVKSSGANSKITIGETNKTAGSHVSSFTSGMPQGLRLNLNLAGQNGSSPALLDAALAHFDDAYSNQIESNDIRKMGTMGESVSWKSGGQMIVIDRRFTIADKDTLQIDFSKMRVQNYQWELVLSNMDFPGRTAFFIDRYMQTTTPINMNGTTAINFSIQNIPGSYASNRFYIVFNQTSLGPLPVNITSIAANRNNDKTVTVQWKVENELNLIGYEVERSSDGIHFYSFLTQSPNSNTGGSASYQVLDRSVVEGNLFYRIKANSVSGQVQYSAIVKVAALKTVVEKSIQVYPNIVAHKTIHVKFQNQTSGLYKIQLVANSGAMVYQTSVEVNNSNEVKMLQLNANIAGGNYKLVITGDDGNKTVQSIIIL
ncbi:MAG: hypothetical protein ACOYLO_15825, partial [Ferruginibacter sp.]